MKAKQKAELPPLITAGRVNVGKLLSTGEGNMKKVTITVPEKYASDVRSFLKSLTAKPRPLTAKQKQTFTKEKLSRYVIDLRAAQKSYQVGQKAFNAILVEVERLDGLASGDRPNADLSWINTQTKKLEAILDQYGEFGF